MYGTFVADARLGLLLTIDGGLYANDARDGARRWFAERLDGVVGVYGDMVIASLTDQQVAGATTRDGRLAAFQAQDGRLVWETPGDFGYRQTLTINGVMLARPRSTQAAGVIAVDAATGAVLWQTAWPTTPFDRSRDETDTVGWSADACYCVERGDTLARYDMRSGVATWRYRHPASIVTDAVAADGMVYAGTADDEAVLALDAATGALRWQYHMGFANPLIARPLVADGRVYAGAERVLVALDASDGHYLWHTIPSKDNHPYHPIHDQAITPLAASPQSCSVQYLAVSGDPHQITGADHSYVIKTYATDGRLLWQTAPAETPFSIILHDDLTYVSHADYQGANLTVYTAIGAVRWEQPLERWAEVQLTPDGIFAYAGSKLQRFSPDFTGLRWQAPL